MSTKNIITIVLLVFVAASVVFIFTGKKTSAPENPEPVMTEQPTDNVELQPNRVVVYYFHGNKRCVNCIKMENYTTATVNDKFKSAVNDGKLEFRIINIDEPANMHYLDDYELYTKSVVISKLQNGSEADWKNLKGVWDHLNSETEFISYVETEINQMLQGI